MIIVRIWEGLGNQLFQYAYARALQQRVDTEVYLDVRHCNRGDLPFEKKDIVRRKLGIQHFGITMQDIRTDKISSLRCLEGGNAADWIKYLFLKKDIGKWRIIDDAKAVTDVHPEILKPKDFTYINAHCVNKGYYKGCRDVLLREMQVKKGVELSEKLQDIIGNRNTVSLHIRLTDYLQNPKTICSQQYYDRAIKYMKARLGDPYFIIFTDDPNMAKRKYRFDDKVFWISEEGYNDYEELMIMSKCRHNIIAWSTYSYWGAWLNQNPGKIVIAPKKCFNRKLYEKDWKVF